MFNTHADALYFCSKYILCCSRIYFNTPCIISNYRSLNCSKLNQVYAYQNVHKNCLHNTFIQPLSNHIFTILLYNQNVWLRKVITKIYKHILVIIIIKICVCKNVINLLLRNGFLFGSRNRKKKLQNGLKYYRFATFDIFQLRFHDSRKVPHLV